MPEQQSVIIVGGPTASGKTGLAVALAKGHHTSIISADSRQCYKELNIGVARPSKEILAEVPHYFIGSHSIHEAVNANTFESYALNAVAGILKKHDTVIVAGGTGLYIRAFTEGLDEIPQVDKAVETMVRNQYLENGMEWLENELRHNDPLFAEKGEMKNPQRMMRALTVKLSTGQSLFKYHSSAKIPRPFQLQKIYIDIPRTILYERINKRVDEMMNAGLMEEARTLFPLRHINALQTVGYSELFEYFENKISLERAVELIKQNTRHYAKRQETWFRKYFVDEHTMIKSLV